MIAHYNFHRQTLIYAFIHMTAPVTIYEIKISLNIYDIYLKISQQTASLTLTGLMHCRSRHRYLMTVS